MLARIVADWNLQETTQHGGLQNALQDHYRERSEGLDPASSTQPHWNARRRDPSYGS